MAYKLELDYASPRNISLFHTMDTSRVTALLELHNNFCVLCFDQPKPKQQSPTVKSILSIREATKSSHTPLPAEKAKLHSGSGDTTGCARQKPLNNLVPTKLDKGKRLNAFPGDKTEDLPEGWSDDNEFTHPHACPNNNGGSATTLNPDSP